MISAETVARIDNINRMIANGQKRDALYAPLVRKLCPIRRAYQIAGRDTKGLGIHLRATDFPKQAEANIDRVVGIDITWI